MAYDDVLSRTALAVERNSLAEKITAANLADLYRQDAPLNERTLCLVNEAAEILVSTKEYITSAPRFNKATLFSWMIFLVRAHLTGSKEIGGAMIAAFLGCFEAQRSNPTEVEQAGKLAPPARLPWLLKVYEDRSSARVADVSSVILRDAVIWTCFEVFCSQYHNSCSFPESLLRRLSAAWSTLDRRTDEDMLTSVLIEGGWGILS